MSFGLRLSAILVVALGLYLIGNQSVSLWDRDEPRYAECSREMLQSGNWVVPHYLGQWRIEKPPLIYWCQATAMTFLGDTPFAARFPSAIAIALTALLLALIVRHFIGKSRALWTALIFCSAALPIAAAKMCITDAVLLFLIATGQACLAALWSCGRAGRKPPAWIAPLFWISTGLAGLTKGPQALGIHAMTVLILALLEIGRHWRSPSAWKQSLRWLRLTRPLIGFPLLALVVAPWLILVHRLAPGFIDAQLFRASQYARGGTEGHAWPPGYHAILLLGTFFPWSLLLPTTIVVAWHHRRLPAVRFAIAAAVGPWLLMEMVPTKLPFYILPAFPGLAFLTADTLLRCIRRQHNELTRRSFRIAIGIWTAAVLAYGAAPWLSLWITRDLPWHFMFAFGTVALFYAAIVNLLFARHRFAGAALTMGAGSVLAVSVLYAGILPRLGFLNLSQQLGMAMRHSGAYGSDVPVALIGYKEPSLAFYQGGGAREQDESYLLAVPVADWPKWFLITQEIWQRMPPSIQEQLQPIASAQGARYSVRGPGGKGPLVTVLLLKKIPPPAPRLNRALTR